MIGFRPLLLLLGLAEQINALIPQSLIVVDIIYLTPKTSNNRLVIYPTGGIICFVVLNSYLTWHWLHIRIAVLTIATRSVNWIKGDFAAIKCCIRIMGTLILPKHRSLPYFKWCKSIVISLAHFLLHYTSMISGRVWAAICVCYLKLWKLVYPVLLNV